MLEIEGSDTDQLDYEAGGHRVQRIPITERRGRVHSSTVTVAVLSAAVTAPQYGLRRYEDYHIEWYSGTVGAGGQNHQKTQTCVRIQHIPTGLVKQAQTRSRKNSLKSAFAAINHELDRLAASAANTAENTIRRGQVGSGQRSDKRRTLRFQDGLVHDHVTNKRMPIDRYMNGGIDALWPDK